MWLLLISKLKNPKLKPRVFCIFLSLLLAFADPAEASLQILSKQGC
jgi:energy-converting hydrogenase Eha subunit F